MKILIIAAVLVAICGTAHAAGDAHVGTQGLTPLAYVVTSRGPGDLSCEAKLAHWYSDHLLTVAAGQTGEFTLWSDDASGTVYRISVNGDRMPVEQLWCGPRAGEWAGRFQIDLPRRRGQTAVGAHLTCAFVAGQTECSAS